MKWFMKLAAIHEVIANLRNLWITAGMSAVPDQKEGYREPERQIIEGLLRTLDILCGDLGLSMTQLHIRETLEMVTIVSDPSAQYRPDTVDRAIQALSKNLEKEMSLKMYFTLPHEAAQCFSHPLKDWEDVIKRWPNTILDIEESSKCFAFERICRLDLPYPACCRIRSDSDMRSVGSLWR